MKLSITGVNHKTAPIEVREQLSFDPGALPGALGELKRRNGLQEGIILSTCNRTELAMCLDDQANSRELAEEFLCAARRVERNAIQPYLYQYDGDDAIRHLFRVAASLDSMVVGEPQILGQLKAAYAAAKANGTVVGLLDLVVTRAFSVAKRVRTETEIGSSAVSVSYVAVELARQIFGDLKRRKVMLVGAGKMSELAARHLRRAGADQIFVTNRTRDRAVEMAAMFEGRIVEYDRFRSALPEIDIVIASSGAPHFLLKKGDVQRVIDARKNRPMFLIDIAVPRNIDPEVNQIDNVFLYDIDDLQQVAEENMEGRRHVAVEAETIIEEEVVRMVARLKAREVTPTIVSIQQQLEALRVAELERAHGRLVSLTAEQREAIEVLTRGLIAKIAHGPISELRRLATQPDGFQSVEVIRKAFRLES
ncbi:MAG: glutamyl-tRNA reductase [Bryobacteraceae bacterium]|nr:glutamyl-tRNA reductase [Bryobacteraceae bacterium]